MITSIKGTGYEAIIVGMLAAMSAQLMKFIGHFLKTRKFNSMLFFSTAPLLLTFGVLTFVLATINNYTTQPFTLVRTALNISTTNNNNYYWIALVTIIIMVLLFINFLLHLFILL